MFTFLRSRLRFAGRIGWVDGRRGYPGDDHFVELALHRPASMPAEPEVVDEFPAEDAWPATTVRPVAAGSGR